MRGRWAGVFVTLVALLCCVPAASAQAPAARAITYVGVVRDLTDLRASGMGRAGYWFPQFDAPRQITGRPTGERAVDARPAWIAPLNHVAALTDVGCTAQEMLQMCLPTYLFRSFSQDGPARSAGGDPSWSEIVLPSGRTGLSGAIVDPFTRGNLNNTVNRLQLRGAVPESFHVHVLTDNTGGDHDPVGRLQARGNVGPLDANVQVDAPTYPEDLASNGVPDVYTFRFDNFTVGDYVKIRLEGAPGGAGASFGGLLFD